MQKGNDSKIVKKGGALSSSLFILVSVITILLISSCSLFEKEKTDTRDSNNILDWVKVPPVGAQFAFYTFHDSSYIFYDTFSILSVDTIYYHIYIYQEHKHKYYNRDSLQIASTETLYSLINFRDGCFKGNTSYTNLSVPILEGCQFLVDGYWSLNCKYVIDSIDVELCLDSLYFDSLLLLRQDYTSEAISDEKMYFSSKYGMNILEIPSDTNEKYIRKLIWVNY